MDAKEDTKDAAVPRIDQSTSEHWKNTWKDILGGGPPRWKDGEKILNYDIAYQYLLKNGVLTSSDSSSSGSSSSSSSSSSSGGGSSSVFVPLAGDCKFVPHAYSKGCTVVVNEQVDIAVEAMRKTCEGAEFKSTPLPTSSSCDDDVRWESTDGKISIWQTSIFAIAAQSFAVDCVYDKDAFGAIQPADREAYVKVMKGILKKGGHVLLEVKKRSDGFEGGGPPFHFDRKTVEECWKGFTILEHTEAFYPLGNPNWAQQAFLMRLDTP